jgi:hypothetical protein
MEVSMARVRHSTVRTSGTGRDLASNHPTMVVYFQSRHRGTAWPEMVVKTGPPTGAPAGELRIVPPPHEALEPVREATPPVLAPPCLVLVAALSIMEGYRWLNVIPARRLHPSALVYVALAVPLLVICTRRRTRGRRRSVQLVGLFSASVLVVATLTETFVSRPWSAHAYGAVALAVAAMSLVAAWALGRGDSAYPEKGDAPRQ